MRFQYTVQEKRRRFWICDRKKCENCPAGCRYTLDIEHAKYPDHEEFIFERNGYWQTEPRERNDGNISGMSC